MPACSAFKRDKRGIEITLEKDLASARIRLANAAHGTFRCASGSSVQLPTSGSR